ncbi:Spondin-1 [Orchesella cincta]|uniref:Spondin-1 n=1 Tax=Orchesella cincta TaxID=48709 RepID=A0A1D2N0P5_ORCCI|nr:Spondin-1 [Orchesella cincta]
MRFLIHHIRRITLYLIFGIILGYIEHVTAQQLVCTNRNPEGHTPRKTEGDGGFRIIVVGNHSTRGNYAPNDVYTVTIQGIKTRYSTQKFTEFLLVAESEKQLTMGQAGLMTTGIFHIIDDYHSRFSDMCPDAVQNVNMQPKTEISVLWTAPSVLVASCVTFKATVVERPHVWHMDDGELTKTLCPVMPRRRQASRSSTFNRNAQAPTPENRVGETNSNPNMNKDVPTHMSPKIPPQTGTSNNTSNSGSPQAPSATVYPKLKCCACDEAKYEVRFEGVWSKDSHPKDFPENEWLLHFSDIIGASHSQDLLVWQPGETASEGLRQVAEWGATRHLENELKSKSQFINTIIKAKGLWHPNERGVTTAAFRVDKHHPLVSLVSMIGPSPDWIVGVSSHNLCLSNCTWLDEAVFDLYPYDAGTDSGITYMSPNTPTEPRQNIRPLTNSDPDDPRSPFYKVEPMRPFAKVHIRRQRIYPKNCNDNSTSSVDAHEIYLTENTEDSTRPECVVTDWTAWSDCSVLCGKGIRMRKRSYVLPMKADMFRCDRQLVEKEMCLGVEPSCAADNSSAFEEFESICAVTAWSDWTPCSHTCGKGTRSRTRRYKSHMGRKKCNLEMTQIRDYALYSLVEDLSIAAPSGLSVTP